MHSNVRIAAVIVGLLALACAAGSPKPGTGGRGSVKPIETNDHMEIPEGVSCYVCHKEDIPGVAYHAGFSKRCDECHTTESWMAMEYPHPQWYLSDVHRTRCNRCHPGYENHEFGVYQCYGCHHVESEIKQGHTGRGVQQMDNCVACHREVGKPAVSGGAAK